MKSRILFATAILVLQGCKKGEGEVVVTAWGEEAAFEGFPNEEVAFEDGWTVTYDAWIVSIADISLTDPASGEEVAGDATNYVVDLTRAVDPAEITRLTAPSGRYDFGYALVPATAGAANANGADAAAVGAMAAGGFNTFLSGSANKNGETVTFAWSFQNPARYTTCENGEDGTAGIVVNPDEETGAEMSLHLDHTYWDRLGVEEASLRFDPIAAWADDSGVVPFEDLAGSQTSGLTDRDGEPILKGDGTALVYDDAGLGLTNLRDFILFSAKQMAHLNGIGECTPRDL